MLCQLIRDLLYEYSGPLRPARCQYRLSLLPRAHPLSLSLSLSFVLSLSLCRCISFTLSLASHTLPPGMGPHRKLRRSVQSSACYLSRIKNSPRKLATPEGNSRLGSSCQNSQAPEKSLRIAGYTTCYLLIFRSDLWSKSCMKLTHWMGVRLSLSENISDDQKLI